MKIKPLANDFKILMQSKDPDKIWSCSPGICICPSGRLVASGGLRGPGIASLSGCKSTFAQGQIFISDDHGQSWRKVVEYPFQHARPFVAGDKLYVLGHDNDLMIISSEDWGITWSAPERMTRGQRWHQAPCNVHYANGCVYLVMEREVYDDCRAWSPSVLAPVLMRARIGDDLTLFENWTFASELVFRDAFEDQDLVQQGISFFPINSKEYYYPAPGREFAPPGWLETNVFQIYDPNHYWHDPEGRTLHLIARLHCGWTGRAALLTVKEQGDIPGTGAMITGFQKLPSGGECRILPLPGGQMKFHVQYDKQTELYWLLSTQATDSMTRADALPEDRYNLPNNQRTRLVLHFSKNMVDWCFAGLVAAGKSEVESRHYAGMVIDGEDLHILSRSGDSFASSAHNGNLITFHTVKDFRTLIY